MPSWLIAALAVLFMLGGSLKGLQNDSPEVDDAKWIAQLKSTPLSEIEAGLPATPFGKWLDERGKRAEVLYFVEACDGSARTESLKKGSFSCVTTTETWGIGHQEVMRFLLTGDQGSRGKPGCRFVIGSQGPPPGSPIKKPTRGFYKLSEMAGPQAGR